MSESGPRDSMALEDGLKRSVADIEAWLFDLDGVLTDTARVHAAAWKLAFDEVLARHFADGDGAFQAFDEVGRLRALRRRQAPLRRRPGLSLLAGSDARRRPS